MKIKPPEYKSGHYERYRIELEAWREITDLEKEKQGIAIALTLPEDEERIREKVFDELSIADLKGEDGLDKLLTFMDKKLKKDDLADSWEKFSVFEEYERKEQAITEYISKFDQNYNKILKKGMALPSEILAFKLLKQANLGSEERLLVLTGMDYKNKKELYEQAKLSLKKFKGDQVTEFSNGVKTANLESVCVTGDEVLYTNHRQQNNNRRRGRGSYRGGARFRPQPNSQQQSSDSSHPKGKLLTAVVHTDTYSPTVQTAGKILLRPTKIFPKNSVSTLGQKHPNLMMHFFAQKLHFVPCLTVLVQAQFAEHLGSKTILKCSMMRRRRR